MRAIAVAPGRPDTLEMIEREDPQVDEGHLLVSAIAVGVCGTDHEIIERGHGSVPAGSGLLVLGHESLGRVVEAPAGSGFAPDDLVVGIVRRPDPEPCACCADGRWDMCLNGRYRERGIRGMDGYASEYYRLESIYAIPIPALLDHRGVLVEPTSIVTKAWRRVAEFADLNCRELGSVLITGAGPIGLLAALLGRLRGLDVHVLDRVTGGPKPELVKGIGASYHSSLKGCPSTDVVIECTGAAALIPRVIEGTKHNSIVCLTGVSEHGSLEVDVGALNRELVLENDVVLGSVNARREDYEQAVMHLVEADPGWLDDVITRRVPIERWREAFERREEDVKTVMHF